MTDSSKHVITNSSIKETNRITKPFKKLGFSKLDAVEVGTRLKVVLANYQAMYNKLRNFHWNVEGSEFFELHEVFEQEYGRLSTEIDRIAERVRIFGLKPNSTPSRIQQLSRIEESEKQIRPFEMVKTVKGDYEILHEVLLDCLESALDSGDVATEFMLSQLVYELEKRHWMFTSYLNEK